MKILFSYFRKRLLWGWRILVVLAIVAGSTSGLGLITPAPANAAPGEDLKIKKMSVSVWPEYDDPRLLAIYQGEFTDGGSFPREVKFKVPQDAFMNMVCALTPKGDHNCQYYETTIEGDYKIITFKLPIPTFFLEYYAPGIQGTTDKSFTYQFPNPPYAIDNLSVEIQQPLRSNNFLINPSSTSITSDSKGFKYFNYQFSNVAANRALSFGVTYNKSDSNASVKKAAEEEADQQNLNRQITIAGVIGLVVVVIAAYFLFRKQNPKKRYGPRPSAARAANMMAAKQGGLPPESQRSPARPASESKSGRSNLAGASFCAKCGVELDRDDVFCYNCGQSVKGKGQTPVGGKR